MSNVDKMPASDDVACCGECWFPLTDLLCTNEDCKYRGLKPTKIKWMKPTAPPEPAPAAKDKPV